MSEPKRYVCTTSLGMFEMNDSNNGEWVYYKDYDLLKSQRNLSIQQYNGIIDTQLKEITFLKSEVERLKNNIAYLDQKLDEELDKGVQS